MRITPEMVVEAYRKTGLKPVRMLWNNGDGGGCGLGALGLSLFGADGAGFEGPMLLEKHLGADGGYLLAFVLGFDGSSLGWKDSVGYIDGQLAAMAVFGGLLDPVEPEKVTA